MDTITRKELYDMVWEEPMTKLSKKFGLSDNGLRKVCKKYEIPLPKVGYWSKREWGKPTGKRPVLPLEKFAGDLQINFNTEARLETKKALPKSSSYKELTGIDLDLDFTVPNRISKYHPIVKEVKDTLTEPNRYKDHGLLASWHCPIVIKVSPKSLSRALHFLNTLVVLCDKLNIKVGRNHRYDNYMKFDNITIDFSFREKLVVTKEAKGFDYRKMEPSGLLLFEFKGYTANKTFSDGKTPLEDKLESIFTRFFWYIQEMRERRAKQEKEEAVRAAEEAKRKAHAERVQNEYAAFEALSNDFDRWDRAEKIRSFIKLKSRLSSNSKEFEEWREWAERKADWIDPLIAHQDPLLGDYETYMAKRKEEQKPKRQLSFGYHYLSNI